MSIYLKKIDLKFDNIRREAPEITKQSCEMTIKVVPEDRAIDWYKDYRKVYGHLFGQGVGEFFHAGVVSLEHTHTTSFSPDIEYSHRVALRRRVSESFAVDGIASREPISFVSHYTIKPDALYTGSGSNRRFSLGIHPNLDPYDSYTLQIRFSWDHVSEKIEGWLDECRFKIPSELGKVVHIEHGRIDDDNEQAIWCNLPIPDKGLMLRITFEQPILTHQPILTGHYHVTFNHALSGLSVDQDRIWNALGRRATERTSPSMNARSTVAGDLIINTSILAQEHEHVCSLPYLVPRTLDHSLMQKVADVLSAKVIHIQHLTSGLPHIDPEGKYEARRVYWDLVGRTYEEDDQTALDVHLVISGWLDASQDHLSTNPTKIDIRVRCMHDPRQSRIPDRVNTLCRGLREEIAKALDTSKT